jgi:pimeloyl-ACP methyl ester carboxylesterase
VQADNLRIPVGPGAMHVERYGHGGIAFVLLHGFATSSFLWRHVAPELAEAGHTAFALDLFGYGESDRPFDADYGVAAQAEYVDSAMTALRVSRGVLVGVDLGGTIGLRLAATRRERVEKLVVINPPILDELPGRDIETMQRSTARFAFRLTRGVLGAAPLLRRILEEGVADQQHMPPELIARYIAPFAGQDGPNHLLRLGRSVREDDLTEEELQSVQVPTLVVWADQDRSISPKLPERLVNIVPSARLMRMHGSGRLVPEESPEQLCESVLNFARSRERV